MASNGVIGIEGRMPWHLPQELKLFRRLTNGQTVIMGRKTFDSIGKPLPNRNNIVVTKKKHKRDDVIFCSNIHDSIQYAQSLSERVYIIGGASIYKQSMPYVDKMYITTVFGDYDGDTYFPNIEWDLWEMNKSLIFKEFKLDVFKRNV